MKNYKVIVLSLLVLIGCSSKNPHPERISILNHASLYIISAGSSIFDYTNEVALEVMGITNSKGKKVLPFDPKNEFILDDFELTPGKYMITVAWTRTIGPKDHPVLSNGDTVQRFYSGYNFLKSSLDKYKITFIAKAGMTYTLDAKSTRNSLLKSPDKICLIEKKHNLKGSKSSSNYAKIVACSR